MEKIVFKVLAMTGVVVGLGVAALPLSSFAANDGYHAKEDSGNMQVNVVINDYLALDVENTTFNGGYDIDGDLAGTWGENIQDSLKLSPNMIATAGVIGQDENEGLVTGVRSSIPYSISLSSADPVMRIPTGYGDTTAEIPASSTLQVGKSAWAMKKNVLKSGQTGVNGIADYDQESGWTAITTTPTVFQTGAATTGGMTSTPVKVQFGVGASISGNQPVGAYSADVTITAAAQV